jgi:hypothetical protein
MMLGRGKLSRIPGRPTRVFFSACHELKTPIADLAGFIEILRGPARDDTAARERFACRRPSATTTNSPSCYRTWSTTRSSTQSLLAGVAGIAGAGEPLLL